MSGLRCAVGLPNVGEYGDPRLLVDLACRAEGSGWDGVFVWDHVAYRELGWAVADPYMSVAAIAAQTSRIRVGVLIAALARRRPWKFAREMATLDVLSEGRLIVGVGLGSQGGRSSPPSARIQTRADATNWSMRDSTSSAGCGVASRFPTRAVTTALPRACSCPRRSSGPGRRSGSAGAGQRGDRSAAPLVSTVCFRPSKGSDTPSDPRPSSSKPPSSTPSRIESARRRRSTS